MPKPQITLAVDKQGAIREGGRCPGHSALLKSKPDTDTLQVTAAGERAVSLQQLMSVMDACRVAGVTRIGLAAQADGGRVRRTRRAAPKRSSRSAKRGGVSR